MSRFEPPSRVMNGKYRAIALAEGTCAIRARSATGRCTHGMADPPMDGSKKPTCIFQEGYPLDKIEQCPLALAYYWATPDRVE